VSAYTPLRLKGKCNLSRQDPRLHDEILALRKQLEQSSHAQPDSRFTFKDIIVVATSTLFAFAGMHSENEPVLYLCLVIPCIAYLYVCFTHPDSILRRSVAAAVIIAVFALMIFSVHWRSLKKEQDDVKINLVADAHLPPDGDIGKTAFTITNGGKVAIDRDHQIYCQLNWFIANKGLFVLHDSPVFNRKSSFPIEPGGDSETEFCFQYLPSTIAREFNVPVTSDLKIELNCADITLAIDYTLKTQPKTWMHKGFRFVEDQRTRMWRRETLQMETTPCSRYLGKLKPPPQPLQ